MPTPGVQTTRSLDMMDVPDLTSRSEPLTSAQAQPRGKHALRHAASMPSDMPSFKKRHRPTMRGRRNRRESFFEVILADERSLKQISIARWTMLCSWVFFFQTLAALVMVAFPGTEGFAYMSQFVFQVVYSTTYCSFLLIYMCMGTKPPCDYFTGVLLYTVGYICFMLLYAAIVMIKDDPEFVSEATEILYISGSVCFLSGSFSLLHATLPGLPEDMDLEGATRSQKLWAQTHRVRVTDEQVCLFLGSSMFTIGSICFCIDSIWGRWDTESKQAWLQNGCISGGYFVFTFGRLYFIWGSKTSDCDVFFRKAETKRQISVNSDTQ